jgi:poly(3-hydroxybutyrate) depolymerase
VPVLAAVSLMASRGELTPLSMVMMGGPIDARLSPTAVNNLAMNKSIEWFEHNVIYRVPTRFPGAGRKVYPGFLQHSGFVAMNPSNHARSHYDYFKDLIKGDDASADAHRKFYDEYNAVLDMDAHYYLDTIKVVFQEFNLVNGTWDVKGIDGKIERVRPEDIHDTALLSIEGELDDISGSGQTAAVHTICTGVDKAHQRHIEVEGAGHYGIFAGRRWREVVYPQVKAFILAYQPKPVVETPVMVASPPPPVLSNPEPEQPAPAPAFVLPEAPATAEIQVRSKPPVPIRKPAATTQKPQVKAKPITQVSAPAAVRKTAVSKAVVSVAEPAKPARKRPSQRHG